MTSTPRQDTDDGAALILALIVITVVGLVVSVLLSFGDSSLRTTVALRTQTAAAYDADGAAQAAINALRRGSFQNASGTQCFGTSNTLVLPNFYRSAGGNDSAAVDCAPDPGSGASGSIVPINNANRPGSAILTLGTAPETGLNVSVSGGGTLRVHGGIFSNSNIDANAGSITTNTSVIARGACTGPIISVPSPVCNYATADPRGVDPNYPAPTAAVTPRAVPACTGKNKLVTFTPGLYTDVTSLNTMTRASGCKDSIWYFPPGTYYFNFNAGSSLANTWTIDTGWLVGGTPKAPLVAGTAPTIPGSCVSPITSTSAVGVQFVFGGESHLALSHAQAELCGTYSLTAPPIAVYGLKTAVGTVPAESGCVTQTPYPTAGCALIRSDNSPNSAFYIQGTTYTPRAALDIQLNNATGQVFKFGVIVRELVLGMTGSFSLTDPVIEVPDNSPGYRFGDTVTYLNVYVCPGASTCSSSTGKLRLRAKVALVDPTGTVVPGARTVTVLGWSVQR